MAKWTVGDGISQYLADLSTMEKKAAEHNGEAIYEGAKIIADEIRKNIQAMPTDERIGTPQNPVRGITKQQKAGLLNGLGIAKMRDEGGFKHVKIGMDGYNSVKTRTFPNGQPNALVIRSAEAGKSFRQKTPVIAPAVRAKKAAAEAKMQEVIEKNIKKDMRQ